MKPCVLVKVLDSMYANCRNRTLYLTFYDSKEGTQSKYPSTRKEFDNNLPEVYYIASVSTNSKILAVIKRSRGDDRSLDQEISKVIDFNFDELAGKDNIQYTVHDYREVSPFAKNPRDTSDTGIYKIYEECLKFDATLYVNLFKLMGGTVSLVIESGGKIYLGHYIDGRVIITETNDWSISTKLTDFYSLNQYLPNYEVIDFTAYPTNLSISKYLKRLNTAAIESGLQLLEN